MFQKAEVRGQGLGRGWKVDLEALLTAFSLYLLPYTFFGFLGIQAPNSKLIPSTNLNIYETPKLILRKGHATNLRYLASQVIQGKRLTRDDILERF